MFFLRFFAVTLITGVTVVAQQDAPLARARKLAADGKPEEAWKILETLPSTAAVARLRVDVALDQGDVSGALASYEDLVVLAGDDPKALSAIGQAVAAELLGPELDPLLRAEACRMTITGADTPCAADLWKQVDQDTAALGARLTAARALILGLPAGPERERARQWLRTSAAAVSDREQMTLVEALRDLDGDLARPLLEALLTSSRNEVTFLAAAILGERRETRSLKALKDLRSTAAHPAVRSAARISLAQLGDTESLDALATNLDRLSGSDLLAVGRALLEAGDTKRGLAACWRVARADQEQLRLEALKVLAATQPTALAELTRLVTDPNPWNRAAAVEALGHAQSSPSKVVRSALVDPDPWVRLRAAGVVLSSRGSEEQP